jgi:hypothetical protein
MSDEAANTAPVTAAAPETRPDAAPAPASQPAAAPGGTSEVDAPPSWLPQKFWDAETKAPKVQDLAQSYGEMQRLIGSRVGDLGAEARRKLAESLPEALQATWAEEFKAKLKDDPEFLTPLREAWQAENAPQVPEAYEAPEIVDTEHPAFAKAVEWAKARGLSQEAFDEMLSMGTELLQPYEGEITFEAVKEKIPDVEQRAPLVANRVRTLLGPQADALLRACTTPDAFLALEKLTKGEQPIPAGGGAPSDPLPTDLDLRSMMRDPKYWRERDPAFVAKVDQGWKRLYGDRI